MHAAIVTGVSRGLGEALAAAMLARGFTVLGVGRTASPRLKGKRFHLAACDLAQPALLAAAITPALRIVAAGKPESVTLINNAAVATPTGRVGHLDASAIATALATNAAAPAVMADLFLRSFPDDSVERRIINVSSGAAQTAIAGTLVYGMSKAAIEMLTRAIAAECTDAAVSLHFAAARHLRNRNAGVHAQPRSGRVSERRALSRLQGERAPQGSRGRGRADRREARAGSRRARPDVQPHRFLIEHRPSGSPAGLHASIR